MKPQYILALVLSLIFTNLNNLMAQDVFSNKPYEKEWKIIDSLVNNGLVSSAQTKVLSLRTQAMNEREAAHEIKALVYLTQLNSQLTEAGAWNAILMMEKELDLAPNAQKPIMSSLLAEMYFSYYQNHQWQLRDRTTTEEQPTEDETTWTVADFLKRTTDLYLSSLESEETKTQTLESFGALVTRGENRKGIYTVVYELLLDRAVDHFTRNDAFLNEPAYQSAFDDVKLLGTSTDFIAITWPTIAQKTSSQHLLEVLQSGLEWKMQHYPIASVNVLDFDLQRLKIIYEYLQIDEKEAAYQERLDILLSDYQESNKGEQGLILLAQMEYWYKKGSNYNQNNKEDHEIRWAWKKAHDIGTEIIRKFPYSKVLQQAAYLQSNIEKKSLSVNIEAVQLPNQYGLISLNYKNIDQLHFRVYSLDVEEYQNKSNQRQTLENILSRSAIQQWSEQLPSAGDFRSYRTESSFKGLPQGVYSLVVSHSDDFTNSKENPTAFIHFWVSELGLLTQFYRSEDPRILVVNRETGAPVEGASIHFWKIENSNADRKIATYTSDENGIALIQKRDKRRDNIRIEVSKGTDRIFPTENHWLNYSYNNREQNQGIKTHFFLDRGLYRPGQTLYFKALLMMPNEHAIPEIVANKTFSVTLFDANHQEVKEIELTANAFGSATGSFTLPEGGLLGQMHIETNIGEKNAEYFRVEEYKRPRFETNLDTLEGEAKLGDDLVIKGTAMAYAGPAIADAEVVYRVTRTHYFPWYRWGWGYPRQNSETTITQGKTTTNEDGQFEFNFNATPDASLQADRLPTYSFNIHVDVVDPSGETRSAKKTVTIAKYPLKLDVKLDAQQDRNKTMEVQLSSKNLDGKNVDIDGKLTIERLDMPQRDWVDRYWSFPDTNTMSKRVFEQRFPNYLYEEINSPQGQASLETVLEQTITINGLESIEIDMTKWTVGHYKVRLWTITNDGDTLETVQTFELNDWEQRQFTSGQLLKSKLLTPQLQPEDFALLSIGSSDHQHHVLTSIHSGKRQLQEHWLSPEGNKGLSFQVTENERGGLYMNMLFVRHNRIFKQSHKIEVPWSNKKLEITYETFRSKLYPGAEEEWIVKIDGPNKDKVAAELLGSMYDASLDQISPFNWHFDVFPQRWNGASNWDATYFKSLSVHPAAPVMENRHGRVSFRYPRLWTMSYSNRFYHPAFGYMSRGNHDLNPEQMADGMVMRSSAPAPKMAGAMNVNAYSEEAEMDSVQTFDPEGFDDQSAVEESSANPPVKIRTDLSETVFFFPQLQTDKEGRVVLRFKAPEALTKWKLQLFAHSQDLAFALSEESAMTQKELMVLPNAPRFLRQGDQIQFPSKLSNLSDKSLSGKCRLELFDVETNEPLNSIYGLENNELSFDVNPNQSIHVEWSIEVPEDASGLLGYRVVAVAGAFSDGEEAALPILTNKILLTETIPLFVRANKKRTFELKHLNQASQAVQHQAFTLEMMTNPAWMAMKALPYLQEYPYDCTEQLVNKYFANALATKLVSDIPKLKTLFESWKSDPEALKSPLAKNQELKNVLLEETPWVLEAQSETEQRERIALLFDLDKMANEQKTTLQKILKRQKSNGAFPWFGGGRDSWYITQYVLEQLTHLNTLLDNNKELIPEQALNNALTFCDQEAYEHYRKLQSDTIRKDANYLTPIIAHYLYVRSHYLEVVMDEKHREAYNFWWKEAEEHVMRAGLQTQALLTIAAQKANRLATANRIYASLRERALHSDELGMYWKYNYGYYWYQLPVETHSLLIETFVLMGAPLQEIEEMKIWLLRQKETNRWETTKATAAAVYTLMTSGNDWLSANGNVIVDFPLASSAEATKNNNKLNEAQATAEAGTGYYKVRWSDQEVSPSLGTVQLKNKSKVPAWGGMYWQYFQTIDKSEAFTEGPMKLERKIYKKTNTDNGQVLEELSSPPSPGDQLTVRLIVRPDRDMEFVHLKDLRASGLEPIQQLSQYRYQGGLGYYQSTTDIGTHFFFDRLPKGEYVLEYDLRVFHKGDFSAGLATLQCMYAPKFSSHSQGQRLMVEE